MGNGLLTGLDDGGDGERDLGCDTERFPFLRPDRIQDADGRRPGEAGYDPTTLYIPPSWFAENKVSPGQQQWWEFKASNFDSLLLFKVGKFYEVPSLLSLLDSF